MKNLFLVGMVFLGACGKGVGPQVIDPAFVPYVKMFEEEALKHGKAIKVQSNIVFGDPGKGHNGYCYWGNVTIDKTQWDSYGREAEKITLIFHELGHCELGRLHDDEILTESKTLCGYTGIVGECRPEIHSTSWAVSIMHSDMGNVKYIEHTQAYLDELFK
jgi:hypothetical protein